jgi:hypothetical protein
MIRGMQGKSTSAKAVEEQQVNGPDEHEKI